MMFLIASKRIVFCLQSFIITSFMNTIVESLTSNTTLSYSNLAVKRTNRLRNPSSVFSNHKKAAFEHAEVETKIITRILSTKIPTISPSAIASVPEIPTNSMTTSTKPTIKSYKASKAAAKNRPTTYSPTKVPTKYPFPSPSIATTLSPSISPTSTKSTIQPSAKRSIAAVSARRRPTSFPSPIPTAMLVTSMPSTKPSRSYRPTSKAASATPTSKSVTAQPTSIKTLMPSTFSHPGALDSQVELTFVKKQIQSGNLHWAGEFQRLLSSTAAFATPNGLATVLSTDDSQANLIRDDAFAAYTQALLWYFLDDETFAARSVAILNSWSDLNAFVSGTDQDKLLAGWTGAVFAPAAEIMRQYSGWSSSDVSNFQAMLRRAYYPQLDIMSRWNGNVDLTQIDAMMAIAVFNEDVEEFNAGIARLDARIPAYFYLTSDGPLPRGIDGDNGNVIQFWSDPLQWVDGLMQETCRDNGHHAQFALGSAIHAMETAWHQGVDLYAKHQDRMVVSMELLAGFLLSGSMQGVCRDSDVAASIVFDTWEVGYNHYSNRRGIALPKTWQLIVAQVRPNAIRESYGWNLVYETLTHGDVSLNNPFV